MNIEDVNVTALFAHLHEQNTEEQWRFVLSDDYRKTLQLKLDMLDFHHRNYISDYGTFWHGVLYEHPFHTLYGVHKSEADILNIIKNHHLRLWKTPEGLLLSFFNPQDSPLHGFFKEHELDGYGLNVPASIQSLLYKVRDHLIEDIKVNTSDYGSWKYLSVT
ncbi:hypothetical protein ACQR3P_28760 [Rhodococcus sp. IEGM1300]